MRNTYKGVYMAHLVFPDGANTTVVVPDHVYQDQHAWDGRTFRTREGIRVRLDGASYALGVSGTGDMVVRPA